MLEEAVGEHEAPARREQARRLADEAALVVAPVVAGALDRVGGGVGAGAERGAGVVADEEAQRRKLLEAQALSGELRVLTRPLSYAKAQEMVPIITKSALSQRGDVQVD